MTRPIRIRQSRTIDASPDEVWSEIVDPQPFSEWFAFCDEVQAPSPTSRVLLGSWGAQRSAVTVTFVEVDRPHRLVYRHVQEALDGHAAPALSISTRVEFLLEPSEDGQTELTIVSSLVPLRAGAWVMSGMFGRRAIKGMLEQSLDMLAHRHAG